MKFTLCLATVCLFALASASVVPTTNPSTVKAKLGLIRVPLALLLKEAQAQLKIYIIVPRNGEKLKLPIDSVQLANTNYVGVTQNTTEVTISPSFPHTGLGPSNQFFNLSSNVVVEIWNEQSGHFIGGSILTLKQVEQSPKQNLALKDSTGVLVGIATLVYEH